MWREAAGPRERWRGQAPAEGEEGIRPAGWQECEPRTALPAPTCLKRLANTGAGFSGFQKLAGAGVGHAHVFPQKALSGPAPLEEEEF